MSLGHTIWVTLLGYTNSYTSVTLADIKVFSIFFNFLKFPSYFLLFCISFFFLAIAKISLKRKKSFKVETLLQSDWLHERSVRGRTDRVSFKSTMFLFLKKLKAAIFKTQNEF